MQVAYSDPRAQAVVRLLEQSNRTAGWLARRIEKNKQSVWQWLYGDTEPRDETVWDDMVRALTPDAMNKQVRETASRYEALSERTARLVPEPTGKIKIYGSISAGDGNTTTIDVDEMDVPMQFARDDYGALIIDGNSMEPFLESSDIAIFRDWTVPKVGHIAAAILPGGEWVAKLMVQEDGEYKLRSLNPSFNDIREFQVRGLLVGFVRDRGPERIIRLNPYGLSPS